ncbi:uncharacterized protein K489DRAFT_370176 [Dissoconium aciculare CBS 342.82]|uniref:Vacuolar membrane protein n=1 Tax=Dissoconium aciculare CBS 342.82 TaxID=1314786 RepID=A0A6J3MAM4_9PEZI|nr:uncharacterized protein K489DRAFT_370176 [Dissoconium aciculare CBS 342.82]KAF1823877.1 hypothetical protein K489DRAFT_370176 [Dissoconium aciculare CBS 342.82]
MGCCGAREKGIPEHTAKWEYLTLSDFRCTSAWAGVGYVWVWFMAFVAIAVFGLDTFTAVNLLAFNKWSSQVQPKLPLEYSRWIFAGCIILSWVLYAYEWQRAIRVIRRGGVAESYMDPLASSLQSMRGKGWKRFLVFTELTKSRKGADYVALFVYFSFQSAIRVILAEGPRQAINAMTLLAVFQADILPGDKSDHSPIEQFFLNIETLANNNNKTAAIYFAMLFTLVIWVVSALSLIIAAFCYILFLWHYIPSRDGRLSIYCRRKIDKRLERIVEHKVKAALAEEERLKQKAELKELKRQKTDLGAGGPPIAQITRTATLPQLDDLSDNASDHTGDDKLPAFPLTRTNTMSSTSTLPPYSADPNRPGLPQRQVLGQTNWFYGGLTDKAPLLANAGYAGDVSRPPTAPLPALGRQESNASFGPPRPGPGMGPGRGPPMQDMNRPFTPMSRSDTMGSGRPFTPGAQGDNVPPGRSNAPVSRTDTMNSGRPLPPPLGRADTMTSERSYTPGPRPDAYGPPRSFTPGMPPGPQYPQSGPPPGPRMPPPARSNTPGFDFGLDTPQPPATPVNAFGGHPGRQNSVASSFSQHSALSKSSAPGGPGGAGSYSRPMARGPPTSNYVRTTPPPVDDRASPNSYEMTSQSNRYQSPKPASPGAGGNGGYVAFNPAARSATSTPAALLPAGSANQPRPPVTVVGAPGTQENYFGQVRDASASRSVTPAGGNLSVNDGASSRGNSALYDDILDGYSTSPAEAPKLPSPNERQPTPHNNARR